MFKSINLVFILIVISLGLLFLNLKQCNDKKDTKLKNEIYLSNLQALKDTVRIEKDKRGETEFTKQALIAENGSLKDLNKGLNDEANKQKGKVIYIEKASGNITKDTTKPIGGTIKEINDTTYEVSDSLIINYDSNNYKKFLVITTIKIEKDRNATILKTRLVNDVIGFNIVTGLQEEDKKLRIFLRSDYPDLAFTKIDGSLIDPKKSEAIKSFFPRKKWGIGIQGGYGINSQIKTGFYIGFGIQYNLWSW